MFVDAIFDCLCHESDSALREMSAGLVKEYLLWCIKQTNKTQTIDSFGILSKRLCTLLQHSNAFKRLGACLAFNQIYNIFRERVFLVDYYAINLLINFLLCLRLSQVSCSNAYIHTHIVNSY